MRTTVRECRKCGTPTTNRDYCSQPCYHASHPRTPAPVRFWAKVHKNGLNGCWTWTGYINPGGAGRFAPVGHKPLSAYRYSWELNVGPIPEGMLICHHCDNRACVRPDHLYVGTQRDNVRDAIERHRFYRGGAYTPYRIPPRYGADNKMTKLTDDQVREIRAIYPSIGARRLGKMYGVVPSAIQGIVKGRTRQHVS